jgi:hypothetical protein
MKRNSQVTQCVHETSLFGREWGLPDGRPGDGGGQFNSPGRIALDRLCNVYVAYAENNRIKKFSVVGLVGW